jgi:hypothetical protein
VWSRYAPALTGRRYSTTGRGHAVAVEVLLLVVGLMLAAVLLVGVGDRTRLPWPALMVLLGVLVAAVPGLPDEFDLDPDLILPLFLPPLLFATAQRTSWALFRARWRSIALLAVALVAVTITAVAGTALALVPGITLTAAVALGAMVAPPDPVAVEAVAGPVRMPRRLLSGAAVRVRSARGRRAGRRVRPHRPPGHRPGCRPDRPQRADPRPAVRGVPRRRGTARVRRGRRRGGRAPNCGRPAPSTRPPTGSSNARSGTSSSCSSRASRSA